MLSVSNHVRLFLARDPVDMRKSFHGLTALTESVLEQDPLSGHLFVFVNRRRDRIKLLYWGGTGFGCNRRSALPQSVMRRGVALK
jgi:transposase